MNTISIVINRKTRQIVNKGIIKIGLDGENLQDNIIFKFDDEFVNGKARVEVEFENEDKSYITLTKNGETYELPIKSVLTKKGLHFMQLVIDEGIEITNVPIFKSEKFYVRVNESINAVEEAPEGYDQWIEIANAKLNEIDEALEEVDNLNAEVSKSDNVATIIITRKDGAQEVVNIYDGERGPKGDPGANGLDAKINGLNTINIVAGNNIDISQQGNTMTISSTASGGVSSVNGQTGDVVIEIPDVSDFITKDVNNLTNYELKSTTGNNIVASINSSTYVMTLSLRNSNNEILNTQTIDLPLETMVVNGSYNDQSKKIILTLQNGNTIEFSVADLVSGLQSEITSSNKLVSDLVDDTNQVNKFVTTSEKNIWNNKSDFSGDYNDLDNKPTIPVIPTNISAFTNDVGYLTQHQDISGKQDIMQYSVIPTASVTYLNKIIQYTGITDSTYTNGYFYNCVYRNNEYVWEQVDVQPTTSGGAGDVAKILPPTNSSNYIVFSQLKKGVYFSRSNETMLYYRVNETSTSTKGIQPGNAFLYLVIVKEQSEVVDANDVFGYLYYIDETAYNGQVCLRQLKYNFTNGQINNNTINSGTTNIAIYGNTAYLTTIAQTIYGVKVFNSIPKVGSYVAPTQDVELTAKKYVDDQITATIGNINTILATLTMPSNN